jgi:hypothetical protein
VDEARMLAGRLLELYHTPTGRGYQAHALRLLGEAAAWSDPPDRAGRNLLPAGPYPSQ